MNNNSSYNHYPLISENQSFKAQQRTFKKEPEKDNLLIDSEVVENRSFKKYNRENIFREISDKSIAEKERSTGI